MTEAIPPAVFDPRRLPEVFYRDPYPTWQRLHREAAVLHCPDGSWILSRHADCHEVYRDTRRFSSDKRVRFVPVFGAGSPLFQHHTPSLVFNDPPLHTRVRRAIGDALSPRNVSALAPAVERVVADLLDTIPCREEFDLIDGYAAAIPIEVISSLLGIPPHLRGPLRGWSLSILGALEFGLDAEGLERGNRAVSDFIHFLETFIGDRRSSLTDADDDLLARLLRVEGVEGGLVASELLHQCIFLLNAGHETTTNLIGNGAALMAERANVRDLLRAKPDAIDGVVEEVLRFESPNQLGNRTTTYDVEIGGQSIPAGSVLTLCIGAANRDEQVFSDPETFDPERSPNPHLAFGSGIHTCAGLNVARLEARIALIRLFERLPSLQVIEGRRAQRARFRGFSHLRMVPQPC